MRTVRAVGFPGLCELGDELQSRLLRLDVRATCRSDDHLHQTVGAKQGRMAWASTHRVTAAPVMAVRTFSKPLLIGLFFDGPGWPGNGHATPPWAKACARGYRGRWPDDPEVTHCRGLQYLVRAVQRAAVGVKPVELSVIVKFGPA